MRTKWYWIVITVILGQAVSAQSGKGQIFKIGGVYFGQCGHLVGTAGKPLLNVGPWRGADTDVDMVVLEEGGVISAIVRDGRLHSGDSTRYRIKRDQVTFALWDAHTGRVILLLRPQMPADDPRFAIQVNVSLDTYTAAGRFMHCDPEHSDLKALERQRTNTIIGAAFCLGLE